MKPFALLFPALLAALLGACDLPAGDQASVQSSTAQSQPAPSQPAPPRQGQTPPEQRPSRDPHSDSHSGLRWVERAQLPREGTQLLQTIARGGPFRYRKDGVTFGNRERLLPRQPSTYYREYTVPTPGEGDRGARRIVCGGQPVTRTAECYYTADHYATFRRVRP